MPMGNPVAIPILYRAQAEGNWSHILGFVKFPLHVLL